MLIEILTADNKRFAFDTFQIIFMSLDERDEVLAISTAAGEIRFGAQPECRSAAFSSKTVHTLSQENRTATYLKWRDWLITQED
jgi:hypothetical protein